jgi:AAA family ATP:ADP antiporter
VLGFVYVAIAACTLPAAVVVGRAGARFGVRRALGGTLLVAATAPLVMFALPAGRTTSVAVYVVDGVLASVLVPQFWSLVGTVLTVTQGHRLFGLIAAAGVLGGVLGSGAATTAIQMVPVRSLLPIAALLFTAAGMSLARIRVAGRTSRPRTPHPSATSALRALRGQPFLVRVALMVFLSTATLLALDYLFKSAVVRDLPREAVGPFVARYYLALNVVSLVVQVAFSSAMVRTMGVAAAIVVTPLLLFLGATAVLLSGGAMLAVLVVKGIDGSLRHSIHRITGELSYLPVSSSTRQRVKPLIDGALGRTAQTVTGAALIALGSTRLLSPRPFALIVAMLALAWLANAILMRGPYLGLLRRAISRGSLDAQISLDPIDLESAELLLQHLASEDPLEVVGAMNALARRGRAGFVPALILLHHDDRVLRQALEMFAESRRTDWFPLCRRLLDDPRDVVRIAAARALARHDQLDPEGLADDAAPRVQGYAAVQIALRLGGADTSQDPRIAMWLQRSVELSGGARLGMLAAIADAPPTKRLRPLLSVLAADPGLSTEWTGLLARAAARQKDSRLIPSLVGSLSKRAGREAVRAALVEFGEPALTVTWNALADPRCPRRLRLHLPKTIARFGTKGACEYLLTNLEMETDGLVRYKSIRALGVLVGQNEVRADRVRVERLVHANLLEHFRLLGVRIALQADPLGRREASPRPAAERLILGLLDDKLRQSLERAFQLLQIAYPGENIHHAYVACQANDLYVRANAGEFLDTLLARRDEQPIRALFRLVMDDLSDSERVSRAPESGPRTRDEALLSLLDHDDAMLAALAGRYASEVGGEPLRVAAAHASRRRPELDSNANPLLYECLTRGEVHA